MNIEQLEKYQKFSKLYIFCKIKMLVDIDVKQIDHIYPEYFFILLNND